MEQLNQSLGALRVDSIDIYLLHSDAPNTPVKEFIYTLNEAKKVGTINVFSFSNWTHQRIETANIYAKSKGLGGF